jgi:hypothetical protein
MRRGRKLPGSRWPETPSSRRSHHIRVDSTQAEATQSQCVLTGMVQALRLLKKIPAPRSIANLCFPGDKFIKTEIDWHGLGLFVCGEHGK